MMKINLKLWQKLLIVFIAFAVASVGFMVKLPSNFSHYDKELHTIFYFLTAAFLNILFAKRNLLIHGIIFGVLYGFGVAVEYAQQYSNSFFRVRIHGNADPEDIHANLEGLLLFSALWIVYVLIFYAWKMSRKNN